MHFIARRVGPLPPASAFISSACGIVGGVSVSRSPRNVHAPSSPRGGRRGAGSLNPQSTRARPGARGGAPALPCPPLYAAQRPTPASRTWPSAVSVRSILPTLRPEAPKWGMVTRHDPVPTDTRPTADRGRGHTRPRHARNTPGRLTRDGRHRHVVTGPSRTREEAACLAESSSRPRFRRRRSLARVGRAASRRARPGVVAYAWVPAGRPARAGGRGPVGLRRHPAGGSGIVRRPSAPLPPAGLRSRGDGVARRDGRGGAAKGG